VSSIGGLGAKVLLVLFEAMPACALHEGTPPCVGNAYRAISKGCKKVQRFLNIDERGASLTRPCDETSRSNKPFDVIPSTNFAPACSNQGTRHAAITYF
jgi:hypothetical protein